MKDYARIFKAFVCPYLAVFYGSCIGFALATGQTVDQMLWVIFLGMLGEMGFEYGKGIVKRK